MIKNQMNNLHRRIAILALIFLFLFVFASTSMGADPLLGDVNGDSVVDISDVILVLRIALGLDASHPCADINNDTFVDISDVILTLRMALGLDSTQTCVLLLPTATTDPATNVNGNSATLNATVNPNGLDTTVYFEWDTDPSYTNSDTTPLQSVGDGTADVPVQANIINLSPSTIYYYRIVATNGGGTNYGLDESFTTPPITLTITSPLEGDTIYRSDVMVEGTVTNTTGNETGVTVNGIVATIYGSQFIVNHVPLQEGSNDITASATDTAGNTASTAITVNAVTTTPHVTLRANIESGIAPLTTYFSVSTSIPNAVATYEMDYEGDAIVDYTGTTFENISFTYTTEGIYYPTITVTDTQGISYSDTIAIVVLNASDLDALLRAKWEAMKTALANQDVNTALNYYSFNTQDHYNQVFTDIYNYLPQFVQDMQDIQLIYSKDNLAKYRIRKTETYGGQTLDITYYIYFVVDSDGIWRIEIF